MNRVPSNRPASPKSLDAANSFDVFISHASEDKESFVRRLATLLRELGVSIWYDEFSLNLGDSLSESINRGLLNSRHGLVVLSPASMAKNWPQQELRGLTVRQVSERNVKIPIWLGVSDKEVREFNLMLADLLAISADTANLIDISLRILKAVRPNLYENQSRDELTVRLSKSSID
jgi:hypothetical protein